MKTSPRLSLCFVFTSAALFAQGPVTPPAAGPATKAPAGRGGGGRGGIPTPPGVNNYYKLSPDSQAMEGVPTGKFSAPRIIPSEVYPGTQHTYIVYTPAQYDPAEPTALMIFCDGQAMMAEPGDVQAHRVLDTLIYRREIPVMLGAFINPGRTPEQPEPNPRDWGDRTTNRPIEYNEPNDRFARVIVDELLPALRKDYNITNDPGQRGVMGASSGAIAAFRVAWFRPDEFRKVISITGSFVDLRGGHVFPELVAAAEKKPLRIFLQDGRNDSRTTNVNRDWFQQNVRLMRALTAKGYDLNYAWGINGHGQKQGGAIFPEMLRWTWRDVPVSTDPNDMVERSLRAPAGTATKSP